MLCLLCQAINTPSGAQGQEGDGGVNSAAPRSGPQEGAQSAEDASTQAASLSSEQSAEQQQQAQPQPQLDATQAASQAGAGPEASGSPLPDVAAASGSGDMGALQQSSGAGAAAAAGGGGGPGGPSAVSRMQTGCEDGMGCRCRMHQKNDCSGVPFDGTNTVMDNRPAPFGQHFCRPPCCGKPCAF
jgi:hypothetical protein